MNRYSSDSSEFLSSLSNKTKLILFSENIMKYEGNKILFCDNYIDTSSVKETIYSDGESVGTDTDIYFVSFSTV